MFDIGLSELALILVVALFVFGPSKLPEVARSAGKFLGQFKRLADDAKETLKQELDRKDNPQDAKGT